ncbi:hypothetical protein C7212DRAFT_341779 [Tuber magnatum]|uniref:Uncharacterized protein n=1 Tax=Tuber magnatum TaxID=42249 RepID=A0A317SYF9_9PEZI|nr:hypothetical protein C7212DRAFT_341779 [Tuber magnatum]
MNFGNKIQPMVTDNTWIDITASPSQPSRITTPHSTVCHIQGTSTARPSDLPTTSVPNPPNISHAVGTAIPSTTCGGASRTREVMPEHSLRSHNEEGQRVVQEAESVDTVLAAEDVQREYGRLPDAWGQHKARCHGGTR